MEGAEPLPRRPLPVLPKLFTAYPPETKRAQHPKNNQKNFAQPRKIPPHTFIIRPFFDFVKHLFQSEQKNKPAPLRPKGSPARVFVLFAYGKVRPHLFQRLFVGHSQLFILESTNLNTNGILAD